MNQKKKTKNMKEETLYSDMGETLYADILADLPIGNLVILNSGNPILFRDQNLGTIFCLEFRQLDGKYYLSPLNEGRELIN